MRAVAHIATRSITPDQDVRVAIDPDGLPYRVVVEGDRAYDLELWPFPDLAGEGQPVSEMTFR